MQPKYKYNPYIIAIVIIIGVSIFGILNYLYTEKNKHETWIICEYPNNYTNYTETLRFFYYDDIFNEYYRDEVVTGNVDENYQYFADIKEDLETDKYFSYDIEKNADNVTIKTYINVANRPEFFNSYINNFDIDNTSDSDIIMTKLTNHGYTCHKERR